VALLQEVVVLLQEVVALHREVVGFQQEAEVLHQEEEEVRLEEEEEVRWVEEEVHQEALQLAQLCLIMMHRLEMSSASEKMISSTLFKRIQEVGGKES